MKSFSDFFNCEEKEILDKTDEFHQVLTHLRYEGKVSSGKNVKASLKAVRELGKIIQRHRNLQEKIIFPFLETHIPRQESVIHFLRTDHRDIQKSLLELEMSLRRFLKNSHEGVQNGILQEMGVYFISFLRHHIGFENKGIHQAMRKELRKDEKLEVKRKINLWLAHHPESVGKI